MQNTYNYQYENWSTPQDQADAGPFNGTLGGRVSVGRSDFRHQTIDSSSSMVQNSTGAHTSSTYWSPPTSGDVYNHTASGRRPYASAPGADAVYATNDPRASGGFSMSSYGQDQLLTHMGLATVAPARSVAGPYSGALQSGSTTTYAAETAHATPKHAIPRATGYHRRAPLPGYVCDICNAIFTRGFDVKRHKATVHGQSSYIYVCGANGCDFENRRLDKARQHVRRNGHGTVLAVILNDEVETSEREEESE